MDPSLFSRSGKPTESSEMGAVVETVDARCLHAVWAARRALVKKAALAQRMNAIGETATTVAIALNVSRATLYRVWQKGPTEVIS